jgi:hypothetical protein
MAVKGGVEVKTECTWEKWISELHALITIVADLK